MKIYRNSLAKTVDSVHEALFFDQPRSKATTDEVSRWIAGRQGQPGAYANMFAPTTHDAKSGIRLFTGEFLGPSASLRHVTGEEASRALILLKSRIPVVSSALERATEGMMASLRRAEKMKKKWFCCGTCDPALWRHITAGGLSGAESWLAKGMKLLKAQRDDKGGWRRFPFYYTLLALSEIDLSAARSEMRHAEMRCERLLARTKPAGAIAKRRIAVLERILTNL